MYDSLANKQALIIGGTKGIGRQIALRFASENVDLIINYHRDDQAATELINDCKSLGVKVDVLKADIGSDTGLKTIKNKISSLKQLDILILNAAKGLERPRKAIDQKKGHIQSTLDTNLIGPWQIIQAVAPIMSKNSYGKIIGLMTPGAKQYIDGYSAVGISKNAFESLMKYSAVELAEKNIHVNCVMAGLVEQTEGSKTYDRFLEKLQEMVPIGRNVNGDDIANLVVWLCSDQSNMLIGQTINIDGGFSLASWRELLN
ncbi:MAG: enoyl-[acyl-carrier-protein] reductase FabL [Dehalococcoidaceae bacterium]|nr:enoyl-[acyl-carrier-protein] reductase FabL [Dehalococcoidaceae bacterium]|tara:strand:+ start:11843 stop:12619 length:777 start_codon:yes stop_codon:yes gene_type:complete